MQEFIKINAADNVAVALRDYTKGETLHVDGTDVTLAEDIARGHKLHWSHWMRARRSSSTDFPSVTRRKRLQRVVISTYTI